MVRIGAVHINSAEALFVPIGGFFFSFSWGPIAIKSPGSKVKSTRLRMRSKSHVLALRWCRCKLTYFSSNFLAMAVSLASEFSSKGSSAFCGSWSCNKRERNSETCLPICDKMADFSYVQLKAIPHTTTKLYSQRLKRRFPCSKLDITLKNDRACTFFNFSSTNCS